MVAAQFVFTDSKPGFVWTCTERAPHRCCFGRDPDDESSDREPDSDVRERDPDLRDPYTVDLSIPGSFFPSYLY